MTIQQYNLIAANIIMSCKNYYLLEGCFWRKEKYLTLLPKSVNPLPLVLAAQ